MLFFTKLPDHNEAGFNEQQHFAKFKEHNIVFNASVTNSECDEHVGCLSIKTVGSGVESYQFQGVRRNVTPGYFLILNNDQTYSSTIDSSQKVKSLSVFFTSEFAADVFHDRLTREEDLLDNYDHHAKNIPEFFQTLNPLDQTLQQLLKHVIAEDEGNGEKDELLFFVLRHLLTVHQSHEIHSRKIDAVKATTRKELYRRLCIAKDVLHSSYMDDIDLKAIGQASCLSTPQLVRQFKTVFKTTPHQYLKHIRLENAARQLKTTDAPVQVVASSNGFDNVSAFCRAFRQKFGTTAESLRKMKIDHFSTSC